MPELLSVFGGICFRAHPNTRRRLGTSFDERCWKIWRDLSVTKRKWKGWLMIVFLLLSSSTISIRLSVEGHQAIGSNTKLHFGDESWQTEAKARYCIVFLSNNYINMLQRSMILGCWFKVGWGRKWSVKGKQLQSVAREWLRGNGFINYWPVIESLISLVVVQS